MTRDRFVAGFEACCTWRETRMLERMLNSAVREAMAGFFADEKYDCNLSAATIADL